MGLMGITGSLADDLWQRAKNVQHLPSLQKRDTTNKPHWSRAESWMH